MDQPIGSNYKPGPAGKSPMPKPGSVDSYDGQYRDNADLYSEEEKFGHDQNPVKEIAPPFRISGGGA